MGMTTRRFVSEGKGERLDLFLTGQGLGLTRSQVQRLLREGWVWVNENIVKPSHRLRPGDVVSVTIPPPREPLLEPQPIPVPVVYQDADLVVVDKPAGLTVHPAPGHPSYTLVNALLALCPDLKGIGGELRPGIVHRLDKDTSGLMVVAKSAVAHNVLSRQWKLREVRKGYLALARGRVEPWEGVIQAPIGRNPRNRKKMAVVPNGREAETGYTVLRYFKGYTLLEVFPRTGRTHQIRVHLAHIGHPMAGDRLYGGSELLERQFLHAHLLGFHHPSTGQWMEFASPLPPELQAVVDRLEG